MKPRKKRKKDNEIITIASRHQTQRREERQFQWIPRIKPVHSHIALHSRVRRHYYSYTRTENCGTITVKKIIPMYMILKSVF